MIRYGSADDAARVIQHWGGSPESVIHVGDHGNSVFSFQNSQMQPQILRLTDPNFRSCDEVLAELDFVNHLSSNEVAVASGVPTVDGQLTVNVSSSSGELIGSSIEFITGEEVNEESRCWSSDFFIEWGRNLALIHKAASKFEASEKKRRRWVWDNEILIKQAKDLIPGDDLKSLGEFEEVMDQCSSLQKSQ